MQIPILWNLHFFFTLNCSYVIITIYVEIYFFNLFQLTEGTFLANNKIRNFCIIAHIDHGKSTLADRILEKTKTVAERDMEEQLLDNMDIERERGITIKARAVRLLYTAEDGEEYTFNLIDTPGHVDFNYEVSRSLAACEGAILVVDASQGIEAQTLANTYLAIEHDLEVLPVVNKIDLPSADPERVCSEVENIIGIPAMDAPRISAKMGINIEAVLEKIVKEVPPPKGDTEAPLKALIFDSYYDSYKGVIIYVRIKEGTVRTGDRIKLMATGAEFTVVEAGFMDAVNHINKDYLEAGEVGYIAASIKNIGDTRVGDTVTNSERPCDEPLPGYRKVNPMVFSGIYPADGAKYGDLRDALEKLQLNDASLSFEPETSIALGFGFRCGFLGLLHMEIIQERLEREYNLDLITTAPSVIFKINLTNGETVYIDNPTNYPDPAVVASAEEPMVKAEILAPSEFVGNIMELCQDRRGVFKTMDYLDDTRVNIHYELPLNEIVYDFFDALKSRTRGYASFDYELIGYQPSKLVKLDILLNGDNVDALSFIVHADNAYARARKMVEKLKENIPRQLFEVPVQAAIGGKIIARETIKAMRKDVLAKCYGGDITRKKKLLEKQKEGKKRMRQLGTVEVPQEAFMSVLKLDE
ncbi:MAG: translation elongation factor 4 [Oscillospiraceae bacterium]|nr:elongation factor 4 [Oscillospiraceae bacterium]MBQ5989400.1 translation elongation factor 4 [Oscillospiraceae bacterium]